MEDRAREGSRLSLDLCPLTGKVSYATTSEADRIAHEIKAVDRKRKPGKKRVASDTLVSFRCSYCDAIHLGREPKRWIKR